MFTIGEINIFCTDLEKSLQFYADTLKFEHNLDENGTVHLRCGPQRLLLVPFAKKRQPAGAYGDSSMLSIELVVEDLAAAYAYLSEKQVAFETVWGPNHPYFVIRDPDGLFIEVVSASAP